MDNTTTIAGHVVVSIYKHPDRLDQTAQIVWLGHEANTSARHQPAVYQVKSGYLLTWAEPGKEPLERNVAILEPFSNIDAAVKAWKEVFRES